MTLFIGGVWDGQRKDVKIWPRYNVPLVRPTREYKIDVYDPHQFRENNRVFVVYALHGMDRAAIFERLLDGYHPVEADWSARTKL